MKVYLNPSTGQWALLPFIESDADAEKVLNSFTTNANACPNDGPLLYIFTPTHPENNKSIAHAAPITNGLRSFESYDDHHPLNMNSVASAETMATTLDHPIPPSRPEFTGPEAAVPESDITVKEAIVYILPFRYRDLMLKIVHRWHGVNQTIFFLVWKESPSCECGGSWLWAFSPGRTLSPLHHLPQHNGQQTWHFAGKMGMARGAMVIKTTTVGEEEDPSERQVVNRSATLSVSPATFRLKDLHAKIRASTRYPYRNYDGDNTDTQSFCSLDADYAFCHTGEQLAKQYLSAGLKQCKAKCKSFLHQSSSKLSNALKPASETKAVQCDLISNSPSANLSRQQ